MNSLPCKGWKGQDTTQVKLFLGYLLYWKELQSTRKGLPSTTLTVRISWHISVSAVSPGGFQGVDSVKLLWRKDTSFVKALQAILLHPMWILLMH